jgi:two-component system, OmpR family, sensor histidine kinase CpxA
MMRTIFAKIFFWFWVTVAVATVSVILITAMGGAQPVGRRWLSQSLGLYAKSSVDFYTHGGKAQLAQYLDDIQANSGIEAALLDPQGKDILGRGLPFRTERVLAAARRDGQSKFHTGLIWAGVSVVHTGEGDYFFVARVYPLRGFWGGLNARTVLLRWAMALISVGLLCWLIARHITAPVRALQAAAGRIAAGDLSVRASPGIPPRNDELADLARDFDRMADRIQSLLRKQQELLGDISHELRSPLARLGVSLELARRGDQEALERMQTDLDRLDLLIEQVLTLTRLDMQEGRKPQDAVNLRKIVESVADDANFEAKGSEKSVVIQHADDCLVNGEAALLRSCVENVVRNAARYTRTQTSVEINLSLNKDAAPTARLTVEDHGPGVPPQALLRLFEPFYRAEESRDRGSGGTGLGLAIAQKVVSLCGGSIEARNREAGGLVIEICLPAKAPISGPQPADPQRLHT